MSWKWFDVSVNEEDNLCGEILYEWERVFLMGLF